MAEQVQLRLLIGDGHTLVAGAIAALLKREFNVVGIVADGRALVRAALQLRPDVVLADIAMPRLNGLDAVSRIKRALPALPILFVTVVSDGEVVAEAIRRGASAVVPKTSAYSELVPEILKAVSKPPKIVPVRRAMQNDIARAVAALSDRQHDVLQLLAEGLSMKEVGSVLNLTTRTVGFHKYRIMKALGVRSDAELVQYAIRGHLLFLDSAVEAHTSARERKSEPRAQLWQGPAKAA